MTTIESLQDFETESIVAYYALAGRLASGEDADPRFARNVLATAGKTVGDLEATVNHIKRVRQLKAEIAAIPDDLPARLAKLTAESAEQIKADDAERLRLEHERGQKHSPFLFAEARLASQIKHRSDLQEELDRLLAETPGLTRP
jgi:chromosome segregation ATPase